MLTTNGILYVLKDLDFGRRYEQSTVYIYAYCIFLQIFEMFSHGKNLSYSIAHNVYRVNASYCLNLCEGFPMDRPVRPKIKTVNIQAHPMLGNAY